jgi:hypothetical protein
MLHLWLLLLKQLLQLLLLLWWVQLMLQLTGSASCCNPRWVVLLQRHPGVVEQLVKVFGSCFATLTGKHTDT